MTDLPAGLLRGGSPILPLFHVFCANYIQSGAGLIRRMIATADKADERVTDPPWRTRRLTRPWPLLDSADCF